ncbi:MAG: LLM class flavin-dependent oxidoreductase [Gammaproteobacteria bacterium]|nr:LLM class flavin-dependent oxidoreductase [Gammaproteobacteria bacterium]MBT5602707.1 LLM class flavin-dependent oxidoreductase [Gammaproteobacteria bacterium]MBT6244997.1 LLM class flavin-dependent oxidoreductase [Gammaproteobacteria bacterium]
MTDLRVGVCYDFRNPPDSRVPNPKFYQEIVEQVKWLDTIGAELVWFTEHHFIEDGYLPSWVPVAGALSSVTSNVCFGTDICLMPFNHPVRLAEDLAVLDNLTEGRVELGLGMGYAPHEFAGFGIPVSRRVSLMDEGIEVLQHCFTGEKFSYSGKRYQFKDVQIKPGYVQAGGPPLWIAAMSEAGAFRAARYQTHFLPQGSRKASFDPWVNAVTSAGRTTQAHRVGIIRSILVSNDPESDWQQIREAERYRMALYRRFFKESGEGFGDPGEQVPQTWIVGDAEHCVTQLLSFIAEFGITDIVSMAMPPGLRANQMNDSLAALFQQVVPELKRQLNQA